MYSRDEKNYRQKMSFFDEDTAIKEVKQQGKSDSIKS